MIRRHRLLSSVLIVMSLAFGLGLFWQKSVSATHSCVGTAGPFGGRRINCTYYDNLAIHPGPEVYNIGNWNWPFGYYNEGLVPNNTHNNAEDFINWIRTDLWDCGFHPVSRNTCPGATAAAKQERFGQVIGSSFIVNTMLGIPGSRFEPGRSAPYATYGVGGAAYAQDNFDTWANRIRDYDAAGLINWNQFLTAAQVANIPGPQCGGAGGHSDSVVIDLGAFGLDQGIYNNTACSSANYMTFRHPTTNQPIYRISRTCGNVTGDMSGLPAVPPHDFNATPTAGVTPSPDEERPTSATFNSGVSYTGAPFTSELSWRYFILRAGSPVEQTIATGNVTRTFTGSTYNQPPVTINVAALNLQAGDRVCNRTRITPAAGQATSSGVVTNITVPTRPTPNICITIVDRPYYRVYGGDVFAGAGFQDGAAGPCRVDDEAHVFGINRGSNPFTGAGSQLATSALGLILDFATGQGPSNSTDANRLSFANNGNLSGDGWASTTYGGGLHRENATCAPDYYSRVNGGAGGNNINPTTAANQTITTQSSGNVFIGAGVLAQGATRTIYVNGNVFITGDITYAPGTYNSANEIPSFRLIVRGNIYVHPSVQQLEGLYVAQSFDRNNDGDVNDVNFANPAAGDGQGRFYTCGNFAWAANTPSYAPNSANMVDTSVNGCRGRRLTVVGAVLAEMLKLNRSLGTRSQSVVNERYNSGGNPAEVFIFSPEVWMSGDFPARGDVDSLTALPPVL